jgi:hypothetical protein
MEEAERAAAGKLRQPCFAEYNCGLKCIPPGATNKNAASIKSGDREINICDHCDFGGLVLKCCRQYTPVGYYRYPKRPSIPVRLARHAVAARAAGRAGGPRTLDSMPVAAGGLLGSPGW